jgi:hypothetical protein
MAVEGAAGKGAPDPNVKLPGPVKAAADRAEALSKQAAEAKAAAPPEVSAPVQIAPQQEHPNPGMATARFDPNGPSPSLDPLSTRVQSQTTNPTLMSPQQTSQEEPQDWQHQFNSMKGRFDQKDQENRRLAGQIQDMQRVIASMNVVQPQQHQQHQQQNNGNGSGVRFEGDVAGTNRRQQFPQPKRVTEKEIADYGNDLIDVMGRRAMEIQDATLTPELFNLRNELNQIKSQLGGVRQTVEYDAQTRMYNQLDKEIPNWKTINSHPDFVGWLQMPDPLSGQIRHGLLAEAFNSQQANRVLEFFKRFLSDLGASSPAGQGQVPGNGALTGPSYASSPQADLLALAAPGRARAGQTAVTPEKPYVSPSEIKQFYTDAANGKYAGREEEYNRIQQEIFAASRENRVR